MTNVIPISHSYAKDYRACPRKALFAHHWRYKLVGVDDARADGTVTHGALEAYYRAKMARHPEPVLAAADYLKAQETNPYRLALASAMLASYAARYADERFEVIHVEVQFAATVGDIIEQGRIDAIVRLDGEVYVLEHKTTSEDIGDGSTYWARLHLDPQVSMYMQGCRHLGFEPAGVLYNVLRKPALRPLKATPESARKYTKSGKLYANQRATSETPEEYYDRALNALASDPDSYYRRNIIRRTKEQEDRARETLIQTSQLIRFSRDNNAWPQNDQACGFYGKPCDYLPVCMGQASLEDARLYYRKVDS